ncbi:MAG: tRNA (adenosine(37)-N6)-threonylcarbamoyltransferase complex dimerization subunit type 1 TsaB, partial [Bacteroidetes bacterium]|nr:tRNA (adenosine(37)-N6)-threonylcarbamoyltransferase complex dimerization subunit type 1 TsaB [Bacteroidota bacterium]
FQDHLGDKRIMFFGNGAEKCRGMINSDNAIFLNEILCNSVSMINLSEDKFNNSEFEDLAYFTPNYLKDFYIK